jgi:hypothetical protein
LYRKGEDGLRNCRCGKYIAAYQEQLLKQRQQQILEEHLPHCPECRQIWGELETLKKQCNNLPEQELPHGLHERILYRLRKENSKPHRLLIRPQHIAIPLAAAILIFLIGRGMPDSMKNMADNKPRPDTNIMATAETAGSEEAEPNDFANCPDESYSEPGGLNEESAEGADAESLISAGDDLAKDDDATTRDGFAKADDATTEKGSLLLPTDNVKPIDEALANHSARGMPRIIKYSLGAALAALLLLTVKILKTKR